MTHDATEILDEAEQSKERVRKHLRDAADWFHEHEGEMFERYGAQSQLADALDIDEELANQVISGLVGDDVDPIVQAQTADGKYVGVAEFIEFDGAYGYLDYHDTHGQRKRVICAQCVHEAEYDTEVTHATEHDPEGTFDEASYDELLEAVHDHYKGRWDEEKEEYVGGHDEKPENVETGASLVSGTTIGGNTAIHLGNDGSGSGLDADLLDGSDSSAYGVSVSTPTDVSGSRTQSQWYQNTTGRPLLVYVFIQNSSQTGLTVHMNSSTTANEIVGNSKDSASGIHEDNSSCLIVVPDGWYWKWEAAAINSVTIHEQTL